ncbi:MAG: T9SS type A sorting domain-containing protein [Sporocytophaga sp.]|uniref:T9SS type A sorting domain-containing protein n=1 Tax=Sporocytophaga sp. TaxID=2231183 RepID=UPI001B2C85C8|nr:T9SS type A sorting domain-containing protein [Sporocytophaga sp.]MBO9701823.1 T9SS type A sorting domain-containing protein [Sporocytophaga sp.]
MKTIRIFFLIAVYFLFNIEVKAQNISGIINTYTDVTAVASKTVTVGSSAGFTVGDRVLIIQMQGASITTPASTAYGDISGYGNAGNYEFSNVESISGNNITLTSLCRSYTSGQGVQLVRVPVYNNPTIVGTLTCQTWNGLTGGVLAFETPNNVTFNSNIDVTGTGFRGGNVTTGTYNCSAAVFAGTPAAAGGVKGEGISIAAAGSTAGLGRIANGGGGASPANSGGAGGSHFSNGGTGGNVAYTYCGIAQNAVGGVSLVNNQDLLFMGGGGGGGYADNTSTVTAGTNGGGIVIITASGIIGNGNRIISNGADQTIVSNDEGAGGGGAGGNIDLRVPTFTGTLYIEARGGNGGSTFNNLFTTSAHGTGGGGSGGTVVTPLPALPSNVVTTGLLAGGAAGLVLNPSSPFFNATYGATAGGAGGVVSRPNQTYTPWIDISVSSACIGSTIVLKALGAPSSLTYNWSGPGLQTTTGSSVVAIATTAGTYTYTLTFTSPTGCLVTLTKSVTVSAVTSAEVIIEVEDNSICAGQPTNLCAIVNEQLIPGDIAIIRYRTDPIDDFAFVPLVNLSPGTTIYFTDNGWNNATNSLTTSEMTYTYTAATTIPAGQVITISGFNLTDTGDQIIAYQGTSSAPRFIYALTSNSWITSGTVTATNSYLPPGLVNGVSARDFATEVDNGKFSTLSVTGTRNSILSAIGTATSWVRDNSPTLPSGNASGTNSAWTFNVTDAVVPTYVWSNGETTQCISVTAIGTYSVTYSDIHGCQTTVSYELTAPNMGPYWATFFGGTEQDQVSKVVVKSNNNIVVLGNTDGVSKSLPITTSTVVRDIGTSTGTGSGEMFMAEISEDGQEVLWIDYIHAEAPYHVMDMTIDKSDDNIYLIIQHFNNAFTGYTYSYIGTGLQQNSLFRLNSNGTVNWSKKYNMSASAHFIVSANDGHVYIGGSAFGVTGSSPNRADLPMVTGGGLLSQQSIISGDMFVMKVAKSNAADIWSVLLDYSTITGTTNPCSNSSETAVNIVVDGSGDIYIAGNESYNSCSGGSFVGLGVVYGVTPSGTIKWAHRYTGSTANDGYTGLCVDGNTLALSGVQNGSGSGPNGVINADIYLERVNSATGATLATKVIAGADSDVPYVIISDNAGNVYVSGYTASNDLDAVFSSANPSYLFYHDTHTSYRPFSPDPTRSQDMFIARFKGNNFTPDWLTYYGSGSTNNVDQNNDVSYNLEMDNTGNIIVVGETKSLDFETISPLQGTYGSGFTDGAIIKLACGSSYSCPGCRVDRSGSENNVESASNFIVYPNPFSQEASLEIRAGQSKTYKIDIFNSQGISVSIGESIQQNQIYRLGKNLPQGIYFIRLSSEQETKTIKVIKTE